MLGVNLSGVFHCAQQAARRMVAGDGGVILMTASTNGLTGHPFYADYNASKAGVILLAKTMALELAPKVRVNSVCPGYVLTPMQRAEYSDEMLAEVNAGIPLGRHATPEEIAALYAFLASDEGAYFTGATISIDGGETAYLLGLGRRLLAGQHAPGLRARATRRDREDGAERTLQQAPGEPLPLLDLRVTADRPRLLGDLLAEPRNPGPHLVLGLDCHAITTRGGRGELR